MPVLLDLLINGSQGPLMSNIHFVDGLVEDEVWVFFVHRIVC